MVHITFLKTGSEPNRVEKTFDPDDQLAIQGVFREEVNIMNPSILIENTNVTRFNYCYIQELGRYYFVKDVTSVRNNIWRVDMKEDPLYTYREGVKNLTCVIDKQQGTAHSTTTFNDGSYNVKEDTFTEIAQYSGGFADTGEFILMTAGAIQSP